MHDLDPSSILISLMNMRYGGEEGKYRVLSPFLYITCLRCLCKQKALEFALIQRSCDFKVQSKRYFSTTIYYAMQCVKCLVVVGPRFWGKSGEMDRILVNLCCIVQTLWQCQDVIEATIPIFVINIKKKWRQTSNRKTIY